MVKERNKWNIAWRSWVHNTIMHRTSIECNSENKHSAMMVQKSNEGKSESLGSTQESEFLHHIANFKPEKSSFQGLEFKCFWFH